MQKHQRTSENEWCKDAVQTGIVTNESLMDTDVSHSIKSCTVSVACSVSVSMIRELHGVQVSGKSVKERERTSGAKTQCKQAKSLRENTLSRT